MKKILSLLAIVTIALSIYVFLFWEPQKKSKAPTGLIEAKAERAEIIIVHDTLERCIQLDNQAPNLILDEQVDHFVTEPNLIWLTAEELKIDWSAICVTGDFIINIDSGHELLLKTDGDDIIIIGDPNHYGDAIKILLKDCVQQQKMFELQQRSIINYIWGRDTKARLETLIEIGETVIEKAKELGVPSN